MNKTKIKSIKNNKLKISDASFFDLFFPLTNSEVYEGTKAALKVPSENNLLKVFGILNATKKTSAKELVPRKIAMRISLKYPSNLLIIVKKLKVPVDLIKFINHISLNLTPFVHLIIDNEKN